MEKKSVLKIELLLLGIIILVAGLWYWTRPKEVTPITSDIILFYGQECPHCLELEKYLEENQIADKVRYDRLEVFHNSGNQAVLEEKAKECGLSESEIGVPFLFDATEKKCLMGTPEIEDFFAKKVGNMIK